MSWNRAKCTRNGKFQPLERSGPDKTDWHGTCEKASTMKILIPILGTVIALAAFLYGGSLAEMPRIWLIDVGLLIISFGVMATGIAGIGEITEPQVAHDDLPHFDLGIPDHWG